jgi:hypothetical protein
MDLTESITEDEKKVIYHFAAKILDPLGHPDLIRSWSQYASYESTSHLSLLLETGRMEYRILLAPLIDVLSSDWKTISIHEKNDKLERLSVYSVSKILDTCIHQTKTEDKEY